MLILGSRARSEPLDSGSTALTLPPPQPRLLPTLLPDPPRGAKALGKGWSWLLPRALRPRVTAQPRPHPVLSVAHSDSAWAVEGHS